MQAQNRRKIKTIFIGTSDFAVPILETVAKHNLLDLKAVITQPDKKAGRKQEIRQSDVKKFYKKSNFAERNIGLYQPEKISSQANQILESIKPELIIVASYGQFIPESMLSYPKYKCLNIHASLLPKLRGAVPMPVSILQGFEKTGISIQIMKKEMDKGDIVAQFEFDLSNDETTQTLTEKASHHAAKLLESCITSWIEGELKTWVQKEEEATYCYMNDISKENARINFSQSALEIERMVRAFDPWPVAWFEINKQNKTSDTYLGKRIKLYKVTVIDTKDIENTYQYSAGQLFKYQKMLHIKCAKDIIRLDELQMEGKRRMSGSDYLFLTV